MTAEIPRILLFDIDGTLLDPAGEGPRYMRRALEDVYGEAGEIGSYNMAGKTDWQIVTELMLLAGIAPEDVEKRRGEAFAAYTRHLETSAPNLKTRLLPGVTELLERLSGDPGFLLGLVTGNVREAVPVKLLAVGIEPALFRFGAFGSEHPDRNVLPALALSRLEQALGISIPMDRALVIGDTPRDIACARYAGVKVLCVATGRYTVEDLSEFSPDYLLKDFTDTAAVLSILREY